MTLKPFLLRTLAVSSCCLLLIGCASKTPEAEETQPMQQSAGESTPVTRALQQGAVKVEPRKTAAKSGAKAETKAETKAEAKAEKADPKAGTKTEAKVEKVAPKAATTAEAAEAKSVATTAAPAVAEPAPIRPAASSASANDAVHQKLDVFAFKCVESMNRQVVPSKNKKEVKKESDGSYVCRYIEVDPSSLKTSYKKPESSTAITYIGYMSYDEAEYVCRAATKEAAMAGPFKVAQKSTMTELVKYVKNGWSY